MEIQEVIAQNIRNEIKRKGLKQKFVAARAGFDAQAFNGMITGRKIIRAEYIPVIADVLGVTPNDLYTIRQDQVGAD